MVVDALSKRKGDDEFISSPIPWNLMLECERVDAIIQLSRELSIFSKDNLTLCEREEVLYSPGMECTSADSLLVYGSIGISRSEAFLRILRLARLTLVQDMASQVVISSQVGDTLPNVLLQPLWETTQVRSLRRWYCLYWAMRCGVLRKIKRRRDIMRLHVKQILKMKPSEKEQNEETELTEIFDEASMKKSYCELLDVEQEEENVPIAFYHAACEEERVSLSLLVANVPTLIVVWASWNDASMKWLKDHFFDPVKIKEPQNDVLSTSLQNSDVNSDAWLKTVMQFVSVPPRSNIPKRRSSKRRNRCIKRAQIILLNIDHDREKALKAVNSLAREIGNWKSLEVSLLPLWCGSESLQSDLAKEFGIAELPFFIATSHTPENVNRKFGFRKTPRICYTMPRSEYMVHPCISAEKDIFREKDSSHVERMNWHEIDKEERKSLVNAILCAVTSCGVPLSFTACLDRSYYMNNSLLALSGNRLQPEISSFVSLSGIISTPDLLKLRNEIRALSRVKNFLLDLKVMKMSAPLQIQLNSRTSTRYYYGTARTVTCRECFVDIFIDNEYHFRCIHCEQEDATLCRKCVANGKHAQHHVLLRLPVGAPTKIPLLWGPSNVAPLSLFSGSLVSNVSDMHIGIYCDMCFKIICGVRWKCAICYQYDLCDQCLSKRDTKEPEKCEKSRVFIKETSSPHPVTLIGYGQHLLDHPFLCIRHGCGTDGDECLKPLVDEYSLNTILK